VTFFLCVSACVSLASAAKKVSEGFDWASRVRNLAAEEMVRLLIGALGS
jgi:hypothetical protein